MIVKLYVTKSENNRLDKVLEDEITLTGITKTPFNILSFQLRVQSPITYINKYNYCYIEELHRYYFITNKIVDNNNLIILSLTVDVLMSYKDEIRNLDCIIDRQEFNYHNYLVDNNIDLLSTLQYNVHRFTLDGNETTFLDNSNLRNIVIVQCPMISLKPVNQTKEGEVNELSDSTDK